MQREQNEQEERDEERRRTPVGPVLNNGGMSVQELRELQDREYQDSLERDRERVNFLDMYDI